MVSSLLLKKKKEQIVAFICFICIATFEQLLIFFLYQVILMWSSLNAGHSDIGGSALVVCVSNTNSYRLAARTLTKRNDSVLEVGSADGVTTDTLYQVIRDCGDVLGVDLSSTAVTKSRKKYPHIQFENVSGTDVEALRALRPNGFTTIFVDIAGTAKVEFVLPVVNKLNASFSPKIIVVKSIKLAALQKQLERGAALFRSVSSEKPKSLNEWRAERSCTAPCLDFMNHHGIRWAEVGISFDKTKGQSTRWLKRLEIASLGPDKRVLKCALVRIKGSNVVMKIISPLSATPTVDQIASTAGIDAAQDVVFVPFTKSALMPILGDEELVKVVTKYSFFPPFVVLDMPTFCSADVCTGKWCFEVSLGKFVEVQGNDIVNALEARTF